MRAPGKQENDVRHSGSLLREQSVTELLLEVGGRRFDEAKSNEEGVTRVHIWQQKQYLSFSKIGAIRASSQ